MLLDKKRIVIMGGSGAIGTAMARAFAREGASVYLGARNRARLDAAAESVRADGGTAEIFTVDCLDQDDTRQAVDNLASRIGEIDVAINATSFLHDQGTFIDGPNLDAVRRVITAYLQTPLFTADYLGALSGEDKERKVTLLAKTLAGFGIRWTA